MPSLKKLTNLTKGKKNKIKDGIDKGADTIAPKAGAHADKVDKAADAAKSAVDKLPD